MRRCFEVKPSYSGEPLNAQEDGMGRLQIETNLAVLGDGGHYPVRAGILPR